MPQALPALPFSPPFLLTDQAVCACLPLSASSTHRSSADSRPRTVRARPMPSPFHAGAMMAARQFVRPLLPSVVRCSGLA